MTPIKAIRAKCLDCCLGQANEVKLCPVTDCSLYPYRLGHNPKLQGRNKGIKPSFWKNSELHRGENSSSVLDGKSYGGDYAQKNADTIAQNEARTEATT